MSKTTKKILSTLLIILTLVIFIFVFNIPGMISAAFIRSAERSYLREDISNARFNIQLAISFSPKNEHLRIDCAQLQFNNDDTAYAVDLLNKSVKEFPESTALQTMLIKSMTDSGEYLQAISYIDRIQNFKAAHEIQTARPETVSVYPQPGNYAMDVQMQFYGNGIYYSITNSKEATPIFKELTEAPILNQGTYYLLAISINNEGLISPLFEGSYSVKSSNRLVFFDDYRFEKEVRTLINQPADPIFSDELLGITSLSIVGTNDFLNEDIDNQQPLSLSDLKWLPNLTQLQIVNQQSLTNLNGLGNLLKLVSLQITNCSLTNIETAQIGALKSLKNLDISNNKISDAGALSSLSQVEDLALSFNRLSSVEPLAGMVTLKKLTLNGNRLETLKPLTGLKQLEYLSATQNNIKSIESLQNLQNLLFLDISNNNLPNLSGVASLSKLETLNATGNRIYDITALTYLNTITSIDISDNNIHNILPLAGISATKLNLSGNNISSVLVLNAIPSLKQLDISNNSVQNISPMQNLTELEQLNINNCPVSDLSSLSALENLTELRCIGCPISGLDHLTFPVNFEIIK